MPDAIVYRFSAPLVLSNASAFTAAGQALLIDAVKNGPLRHTVVIDWAIGGI